MCEWGRKKCPLFDESTSITIVILFIDFTLLTCLPHHGFCMSQVLWEILNMEISIAEKLSYFQQVSSLWMLFISVCIICCSLSHSNCQCYTPCHSQLFFPCHQKGECISRQPWNRWWRFTQWVWSSNDKGKGEYVAIVSRKIKCLGEKQSVLCTYWISTNIRVNNLWRRHMVRCSWLPQSWNPELDFTREC